MPTGSDLIREEIYRVGAAIAALADLWTIRADTGTTIDGAAEGATYGDDSEPRLVELSYDDDIETTPKAIHRMFQVELVGDRRLGGTGGVYSGQRQDKMIEYEVKIGYHVFGGAGGDWRAISLAAAQDTERVRQELEHPSNRTVGTGGTIVGGETVRVNWTGTAYRRDRDRRRLIAVSRFVSELRVTTERP